VSFAVTPVYAESPPLILEHLTPSEGLPQSTVMTTLQDKVLSGLALRMAWFAKMRACNPNRRCARSSSAASTVNEASAALTQSSSKVSNSRRNCAIKVASGCCRSIIHPTITLWSALSGHLIL